MQHDDDAVKYVALHASIINKKKIKKRGILQIILDFLESLRVGSE
jgi:hypothetical protein